MVLPVVVASGMVACGGRRQRWKVAVLFTDHDERLNGQYRWVEKDEVVLPVVVSSEMVASGCVGRLLYPWLRCYVKATSRPWLSSV